MTLSVLGTSPCGKFSFSEENILKTVKVERAKKKKGAFGVYASGDSMDLAKLPDGSVGIKDGDVLICRSLEHEELEPGKVVLVLRRGETCVKRLGPSGRLVPESSNTRHKPFYVGKEATVQAVVIGKV